MSRNVCYMKLLGPEKGPNQLADCGRRFAQGEAVAAPFIVCEDCAELFDDQHEAAKDRRAIRKEWEV